MFIKCCFTESSWSSFWAIWKSSPHRANCSHLTTRWGRTLGREGLKLTDELKLIKGFTGHSFPLLLKQELPRTCNCSFITMWMWWAPSRWDSDSVPYQSVSCSLQVLSQDPHCISCLACSGEIQLDIISILLISHSAPPISVRSTKAQQLHINVKRGKEK